MEETPSETPGNFMTGVGLTFTSPEQAQAFINKMLELGRQELEKENQSKSTL